MSDDASPESGNDRNPVDHPIEQFERQRTRLRAVALRLLGSAREADAAIEETRRRLRAGEAGGADDLSLWLTQLVTRVAGEKLRERQRRQSPHSDETGDPGPARSDVADAVSFHLLVALERLDPKERLAFLLRDMFAMPYSEIGVIVDRSAADAEALATNARRRVRGGQ